MSLPWWRHQMETFSALLVLCAGNWGIQRSSVNPPLMFSLICPWINGWVNNRESCDLRLHCGHYDVTVMHFIHIYFSVITPFVILNALLLSVALNCWSSKTAENVPISSNDLQTSATTLGNFNWDHKGLAWLYMWRECVGGAPFYLRLRNCRVSYIPPRAFEEWPRAYVSK